MRLIESTPAPRRGRAGTVVSIALHVALIAGAVVGTATARPSPAAVEDRMTVVYNAPVDPSPPTSRRSTSVSGGGRATTPNAPLPSFDAPANDAPSIDIAPTVPEPGPSAPVDLAGPFVRGVVGGDGIAPSAPWTGEPLAEHLVDRAVVSLTPARPRYPEMLRAAGIEGRAVVRFVVDTTGRVEPGTPRIVSTTHAAFGDAALSAVPSLRFRPAEVAGHRVRQLVELPFDFVIR